MITIFYSWQSTTEGKYNRNFINDCIKVAIKQIQKVPDFKGIDFEIQEGIRGEAGSPSVAETITDERIPNCDIFIADLSVVNWIPKWKQKVRQIIRDKYKSFLNDNVRIEYGVAMNAIGVKRIIGVINNTYGSPQENVENLPFDIRHLRFPIGYKYSSSNENRKTEIKNQLIIDLTNAIKNTVPLVLQTQKSKFIPFITWNEWNVKMKNPQAESFINNSKIQVVRTNIIDFITDSTNPNPIRLLGLSGLGKTRIIFEIFRPQENDSDSLLLSNRVLYLNSNDYPNQINFPEIITKIKKEKSDAILIIDNCDLTTHRTIVRNLNGLSLISIDSNPEEEDNPMDTIFIKIGKNELVDVVEKIVDNNFDALGKEKTEMIKQFSQGIPLMAVLLGESVKNGEQFIGKLDDKYLLNKLLGKCADQMDWKAILRSCSLFDYFGYENELSVQYEFIATNENITISNSTQQVRLSTFLEVVKYYQNREIFERRGRFLSMRPFPLAMALAQEWLETCTPKRLLDVINDIANLKEPHRTTLTNSLAEQMKYLGYNDNAKTIIEKIVGIGSPFDNAEVLNTELGSRLFRSFVEVNPIAVSQYFHRQFSNKTTEELLNIVSGRRNIVWTLEKLCFDRRTFNESAKILYAFAVAENETWANNATGQFLHLFYIFLSGTEADLKDKWRIIEWGLNKQNDRFKLLSIKAMRAGLNANHFYRTGGAEKQGTKLLQDNYPTGSEILEYWDNILAKLTAIIEQNNQYSDLASEIVANSIREVIHTGFAQTILPYLVRIVELKKNDWDKGLENLKMTLHYERNTVEKESVEQIQKLIDSLIKTDFVSRFFSSTQYDGDDIRWSSEKFIQREIKRMENLAKEFIDTNMSWDEILLALYKKEEEHFLMYKSHFGKKVYEYINKNRALVNLFVDKSLAITENIRKNNLDFAILVGFIEKAEQNTKDRFYLLLFQSEILNSFLFHFISFDENGKKYFDILFDLIDKKKCELSSFTCFKYCIVLKNLTLEEILSFRDKLFSYGSDGYAIFFYLYSSVHTENVEIQNAIKSSLKKCVFMLGTNYHDVRYIQNFEYTNIITDILKNNNEKEFAVFVTNSIINSISCENKFHSYYYIEQVFEILMKNHFKSVWPILSKYLISEDAGIIMFWKLKEILGSRISASKGKEGVLFLGDIDEIFKWCHNNSPPAPIRIAGLVPIYNNNNQDLTQWNPIAKRLIDEFGDNKAMLDELNSNMYSVSWIGSMVPLLQSKKKLFESISEHPLPQVAEWAKQNIHYTEKEIEKEKYRDFETFL